MDASSTQSFLTPYLLWDKDPKESKIFFEKNKENQILETGSLALYSNTPHPKEKIVIPVDILTSKEGFSVVCQKVYLIGSDLLVLSELKGEPSKDKKVGRILDRFVMNRPLEMKEGIDYDFIHFIMTQSIEGYEDINDQDAMVVCTIEDEKEFYHHLNLCTQIPDYVKLLKQKIQKKKFGVIPLQPVLEEPALPSNKPPTIKWTAKIRKLWPLKFP